ncbi:MAG: GNAT family N-acetyltransferase [Bacillota bacterium]|nr:GNAT family N-acetyltransferase [Bacillota bacterium]
MGEQFVTLNNENLEREHICCAIADKKHQEGVSIKKAWLHEQMNDGHVFRKLDARGKVFIEYAPLEKAWVPMEGNNFFYIYCLWVAGSYKGKGDAKNLLESCIEDAKSQGKSGVCVLSSKKKKPFLSEKKFFVKHGFEVVDTVGDYELLAYSWDGNKPCFKDNAKCMEIENKELTIFYGKQCPYIPNCIKEIQAYCDKENIPLSLIPVDTLEKAQSMPCVFNNWAVFYNGKYLTNHLLNENLLKKLLNK